MAQASILKRHRTAAALGAAILVVPVVAYPLLGTPVFAASPNSAQSAPPVDSRVTTAMSDGSVAPIVDADKPAVVTIISKMSGNDDSPAAAHGRFSDPRQMPFDEFFWRFFGQNGPQGFGGPQTMPFQPQPDHEMTALGSGFIIDKDGTIVTNNHVVDGGKDIKVRLDDGTELPAKVVGRDAKSDLAVIRVKAEHDLPTISWGDSDKLSLGDRILAIGNPFGIGTTVTSGIVSAFGRQLDGGPYDDFIQVDAPINSGNSGGPLVAMNGQVVGIDSAIYSPNGGNVGVGFAIPSDEAKQIVRKLIDHGSIEHGYIGVEIQPVTDDVKNALGLDNTDGALVANVADGTPASKAGLKPGDIITKAGDAKVDDAHSLARIVADLKPGSSKDLTVERQGKTTDLKITVGDMNKMADASSNDWQGMRSDNSDAGQTLGMQLSALTPETRAQLDLPSSDTGVLVEDVDPSSTADDDGIQPGDVIVSVNQQTVRDPSDVASALSSAENSGRKQVLLLVERGDQSRFVALPVANG